MSMPVISAQDLTVESVVDENVTKYSPMIQFYRDKTIFVTGGTGFLGMLFIEKLLRCGVKSIYVLVRPKKNKSPAQRIQETFAGEIFVKLKELDPDYMMRIKLIEGDTYRADLGISDDDRKEIIANVEIVIHAAADVRFDKSLQELCLTNVRGTKSITLLAEQMQNLIVFAYISTAFSQFYRDKIEEKFYPPPCDPDEMIRIVEHFDQHQTEELNFLTDKLLRPWENTYVFTKALSEELVRRVAHKFPTIVVRPSIIIATYEDPLPAWTNNVYGLNGFCFGIGLGCIRVAAGSDSKNVEVVCADFVTNGTLAAMWNKANEQNNTATNNGTVSAGGAENVNKFDESSLIVHLTAQDAITCGQFQAKMIAGFHDVPSALCLSRPSITFAETGLMFFLLTIMYHVVPAIMLDTFFRVTNNKNRLLPVYRKYQDFLNRTAYFSKHVWRYGHQNMKQIIENMSEEDQRFFPCDIFKFKTIDYIHSYYLGLRQYLAKESLDNLPYAKRRYRIIMLTSFVTSTFYYSFLGCLLYMFMHVTGVAYYIKECMWTFI
ncbi:fatty acyl-CoA reductase wat-like [Bradysia coprophila]|uniref:fatty acyl-CoA reductase wat-like n=1 Tax=Bradysia coprophila TaxID=38358 RepID=UPI00187DBB73|nr:fatty acyl-CoA reductase wat-like [Bradysia coprophila]